LFPLDLFYGLGEMLSGFIDMAEQVMSHRQEVAHRHGTAFAALLHGFTETIGDSLEVPGTQEGSIREEDLFRLERPGLLALGSMPQARRPDRTARATRKMNAMRNWLMSLPCSCRRTYHFQARASHSASLSALVAEHLGPIPLGG